MQNSLDVHWTPLHLSSTAMYVLQDGPQELALKVTTVLQYFANTLYIGQTYAG